MSLRTKVFSAIRWTAGARLLSQIFTWMITLVVIRLLTPGDYGLLAIAGIFLGFMLTIADAGIGPVLVQRTELGSQMIRQVFGVVLIAYFSLACLLALGAPLIASFFGEPRLISVIRVLTLQLVLSAFAVIPDAILQRSMEFRNRSLLDLGSALLGSTGTLVLALAGFGVWAIVIGTLMSQIAKTVGVNLLTRGLFWPDFSLSGTRSLFAAGSQTSMNRLVWFSLVQADSFIAGKWLGRDALGAYSVAMHIASLPNQRVSSLINQVAFPAFSRIQHDLKRVASHTLLGVRVLSMISFPLFWGISAVAPEIVLSILGPKWIAATLPLQVLSLVMPLRTVNTFVPNATQGLGRFDVDLQSVLLSFFVTVPAFVVGVQWGLTGLCFAWLIATPVVFIINMQRNARVLEIRMITVMNSMARPAVAAFLMYCAVAVCKVTILATASDIIRLVVSVLVGICSYATLTLLLNKNGAAELRGLLRELGGGPKA